MKKTCLYICLVLVGSWMVATPVQATGLAAPLELGGYAWSSNTGWLSMNCTTGGATGGNICGTSNYQITIATNGALTGYAWSPGIGWVRFGGLSGFPTGGGTSAVNAAVTGTFPNFTMRGWARACAVFTAGCSGALKSDLELGGWDGWIALNGSTHSITTGPGGVNNNSYAWGASVIGWIDFNPVGFGSTPVLVPSIDTFTVTPVEVTIGSSLSITYNVTNASACTASNNRGQLDWQGARSTVAGNQTSTVVPPSGTTIYTLTCTNGGVTVTQSETIVARPDIIVSSLTYSTSNVNEQGIYDWVNFGAQVQGLPAGQTVSYRMSGAVSRTGTVTNSGGVYTFSPTLRFTSVPFTTSGTAQLEIDLPAPGSLIEDIPSTAANEDVVGNSQSRGVVLAVPEPDMSLTGPDLIRSGETVLLAWSLTAPYATTCTIIGPGINQSVSVAGSVGAAATASGTVGPSAALTNAARFQMQCSYAGVPYTITKQVEVVPTFQEV